MAIAVDPLRQHLILVGRLGFVPLLERDLQQTQFLALVGSRVPMTMKLVPLLGTSILRSIELVDLLRGSFLRVMVLICLLGGRILRAT